MDNELRERVNLFMTNPYPPDIFVWNNIEPLDFTRGRFNKHIFEVWEAARIAALLAIEDWLEDYQALDDRMCDPTNPDSKIAKPKEVKP